MSSKIEEVYNPESFRELGHQLVDLMADHLKSNLIGSRKKVIDFVDPELNLKFWDNYSSKDPITLFKDILENSIQIQHPGYMGHQVCFPAPLAALAGFQGLMLNSGGAIYEMSAAASTLEKIVIDRLRPYFGFFEGDGIITSGGTLANLTALICARNIKASEDVWNTGQQKKYAFMVSEEAHYCIDRAVRIMGWGDEGIIKIPVTNQYRMDISLMEEYLILAIQNDIQVLGVVGSAPTTSTGKFDSLEAIGEFCQKHHLWYHIDAAHGGPAVFSKKYKYLMQGCSLADSITVDAHKMMMTPSLTTMLFFKKTDDSYKTFAQKAQYLWSSNQNEWYNYGKRTMECTKIMLSTRIYTLLNAYGIEVFEENVDRCFDNAQYLASLILEQNDMELAVEPDSNIVCFRVLSGMDQKDNEVNLRIRKKILTDGEFYIVQTDLKGKIFLRVSLMNPFTDIKVLRSLIQTVKKYAAEELESI